MTTMIHSTLLGKRLKSCVISATLLGIMDFALFMADYIISGRFLGENALAGLTAMNPLITFLTFFNIIIPAGSLAAISLSKSSGDINNSSNLFSQGLIVSLLLGVISSIILFVLCSGLIESVLLSQDIITYATQYCKGLIIMPLFMFLNTYLYYIHIGEGFENYCIISSMAKLTVNITLDIILCPLLGTLGVGIATTLGYLASLIIKIIPLFNRRFSLKIRFYLNRKSIIRLAIDGITLSCDFICPVIFSAVMNATILLLLKNPGLIIFSVILNIENLCMSLYSYLANSIQSLICQYHSEGNYINIRKTMNYMGLYILISSIIISVIVMILSVDIAVFFGIKDAFLISDAASAIRLYAPFIVFLGIMTLLSRYYVYIKHRLYGFTLILLSSVIIPLICLIIAYLTLGKSLLWLGLGTGYVISCLLNLICTGIYRRKTHSECSLVLLLDKKTKDLQLSYNILATSQNIKTCLSDLRKNLSKIDSLAPNRRNMIIFMVEENCMNILDKSTGKNNHIEINLYKPAKRYGTYHLLIRSDCITDSDSTTYDKNLSFREGIISNVMNATSGNFSLSLKNETVVSYRY